MIHSSFLKDGKWCPQTVKQINQNFFNSYFTIHLMIININGYVNQAILHFLLNNTSLSKAWDPFDCFFSHSMGAKSFFKGYEIKSAKDTVAMLGYVSLVRTNEYPFIYYCKIFFIFFFFACLAHFYSFARHQHMTRIRASSFWKTKYMRQILP